MVSTGSTGLRPVVFPETKQNRWFLRLVIFRLEAEKDRWFGGTEKGEKERVEKERGTKREKNGGRKG